MADRCPDRRLQTAAAQLPRQSGKSTTVAYLSILESARRPGTKVLLLAPSLRQLRLLFKTAAHILSRVGQQYIANKTIHELNLTNYSQIICLPCKEETIRGYANVDLLVIDEAAEEAEMAEHLQRRAVDPHLLMTSD